MVLSCFMGWEIGRLHLDTGTSYNAWLSRVVGSGQWAVGSGQVTCRYCNNAWSCLVLSCLARWVGVGGKLYVDTGTTHGPVPSCLVRWMVGRLHVDTATTHGPTPPVLFRVVDDGQVTCRYRYNAWSCLRRSAVGRLQVDTGTMHGPVPSGPVLPSHPVMGGGRCGGYK